MHSTQELCSSGIAILAIGKSFRERLTSAFNKKRSKHSHNAVLDPVLLM